MKRLAIFITTLTILTALFFASTTLTAQEGGTRIVFISSRQAIAAHPSAANLNQLQEQARQEISDLQAQLQTFIDKLSAGQQLTTAEREQADTLQQTLVATQQRWQQDIEAAAQPAVEAVNEAITAIAQENGYDMVLDGDVAGPSGLNLIVFARPELDITQQVVERIR